MVLTDTLSTVMRVIVMFRMLKFSADSKIKLFLDRRMSPSLWIDWCKTNIYESEIQTSFNVSKHILRRI